jgi:hypothetical protein
MAPTDPALSAQDRARLAAILGRLGSDHAGERDAAALAASRFLRQRKLAWGDVLGPPALPPPIERRAEPFVFHEWPLRWRGAVRICCEALDRLNQRDRDFIQSLATYEHQPSSAQLRWLFSLTRRVLAGGAP